MKWVVVEFWFWFSCRLELKTEVYQEKKNTKVLKRFGWLKMRLRLKWRRSSFDKKEEECVICLEKLKVGENIVHLSCDHKFHVKCLIPWLESNSQCPCCRMEIF